MNLSQANQSKKAQEQNAKQKHKQGEDQGEKEEEEDDYMNMTFTDPLPVPESSFARAQRLKRESSARGIIKSKAELAQDQATSRAKALSTSILFTTTPQDPFNTNTTTTSTSIDDKNKSKGLAMMAKMGFKGGGLGKKSKDGTAPGMTEPIMLNIKQDRGGIGLDTERKRKLDEQQQQQQEEQEKRGYKAVKVDLGEYRERMGREREEGRLEAQVLAAQRLAESLDENKKQQSDEENGDVVVPVVYRGLVQHRAEKERERERKRRLEESLSRLPVYKDEELDEDDKIAVGEEQEEGYLPVNDELGGDEEKDGELEEFNGLEARERLRKILDFLRERHWYCFWCKAAYPDSQMDGCPGVSEEDHD